MPGEKENLWYGCLSKGKAGGRMSIGYACKLIGVENANTSALRLKNATDENLRRVIDANLDALEVMIQYNIKNSIKLFRISSDVIPLGSHPINKLPWWKERAQRLQSIGSLIAQSGIRVSMHPGQYTVLNSTNPEVVERAVEDLAYHCRFLDSLGCDQTCKVILHVGGVYGDKKASMDRFMEEYRKLPLEIKGRLVIENDDKSYSTKDVLTIAEKIHTPVIFDNLHHQINGGDASGDMLQWIRACSQTWGNKDGKQKIHYSQQSPGAIPGAHSDFIQAEGFLDFYKELGSLDLDIMLEVKDKNLSAIKCSLLTQERPVIQDVEREWTRYKYFVLSRSSTLYSQIRNLLKDKNNPDPLAFYQLIEKALMLPEDPGAQINAIQHIWGYVNKKASARDKKRYLSLVDGYRSGKTSVQTLKRFLFRLSGEQSVEYLVNSLYFYI